MTIDASALYYYSEGVQVVLRSKGRGANNAPLPDLVVDTLFVDGIANVTLKAADGGDASGWKLSSTLWTVTPSPRAAYSANRTGAGPDITFQPSSSTGITQVTASVPKVAGGYEEWTFDIVSSKIKGYPHSIHPREYSHGGSEKIQTVWGFGFDRPNCVAKCYQVGGEGTSPENRRLVHTDTFDWVAPKAQSDPGWHTSTFTRDFAPSTDSKGYGADYIWEMEIPESRVTIRTRPRSIYVYPVVIQDVDYIPEFSYPSWASRYAGDSKTMFDPASSDYASTKAEWTKIIHARDNGRDIPGIWVNYKEYNARYWFIDLDTYTGPYYSGNYNDQMKLGFIKPGLHGTDNSASPYPAVKIADDIPIPDYAYPTYGTDAALTIVGTRGGEVDTIWDIWMFQRRADGSVWGAGYARTNATQDYRQTNGYTVSAAGLPYFMFSLTVPEYKKAHEYVVAQRAAGQPVDDDVVASIIKHPLGCALRNPGPNVDPKTGAAAAYPYPSVHNDGTNPSRFVPSEGQFAYIRGDVDLDALNLTVTSRVFAAVAKIRGMIIVDRTNDQIAMLTEDDRHYGGGYWDSMIDFTNNRNLFTTRDDIWEIGKRYSGPAGSSDATGKALFDADTGSAGYDMSVANGPVIP